MPSLNIKQVLTQLRNATRNLTLAKLGNNTADIDRFSEDRKVAQQTLLALLKVEQDLRAVFAE